MAVICAVVTSSTKSRCFKFLVDAKHFQPEMAPLVVPIYQGCRVSVLRKYSGILVYGTGQNRREARQGACHINMVDLGGEDCRQGRREGRLSRGKTRGKTVEREDCRAGRLSSGKMVLPCCFFRKVRRNISRCHVYQYTRVNELQVVPSVTLQIFESSLSTQRYRGQPLNYDMPLPSLALYPCPLLFRGRCQVYMQHSTRGKGNCWWNRRSCSHIAPTLFCTPDTNVSGPDQPCA